MSKITTQSRRKKAGRRSPLMPAILLGGGVLLILLALWAGDLGGIRTGGLAPAANGTPRLQSDRQTIDLGDVKLGNTVSASFTLTNTGDALLKFEEAPYVEAVEGC